MKNPKDFKMKLRRLVSFCDVNFKIEKFKSKNKYLEIKIDKLFRLMKQHAFDPDSLPEDRQHKPDVELPKKNIEIESPGKAVRRCKIKF